MSEICIPNVEPDHEIEIKNALEVISKCTKAEITAVTVSMLKINWPDDHPELGAIIRTIVGIVPEKLDVHQNMIQWEVNLKGE